ncbi:MAG: OsmC family protein [Myxococcales bacterium FL481]|nr:MAG: OsmC family protein [Myxococcales bacterium FL481]
MVKIEIQYSGGLRCQAEHTPSGQQLTTDAPTDNRGRGESFSPTDLVATALGTCAVTVMGIAAQQHGWNIDGVQATVDKHMVAAPARRVGRLDLEIRFPQRLEESARTVLEEAGRQCPVAITLGDRVELHFKFVWPD